MPDDVIELRERIQKLEDINAAMNKRLTQFMDHYGRDFDNRVAEAMTKARARKA